MNGMLIEVHIFKYYILSTKFNIFLGSSSSIWDVSLKMIGTSFAGFRANLSSFYTSFTNNYFYHRFPIQIQYSGDISGSIVSKNSIYKSKQRCIVIDGSSNIVLSENVATDYTGQCYYLDHNATDNSILNNYASYGYGRHHGLGGDNKGTGFRQINGPNIFDGNVAVGNDHNGFKLSQARRLQREDGSNDSTDARRFQYGDFKNNIAAGNGNSGFIFESNFQPERVTFDNLLAYSNRYYGKNVHVLDEVPT